MPEILSATETANVWMQGKDLKYKTAKSFTWDGDPFQYRSVKTHLADSIYKMLKDTKSFKCLLDQNEDERAWWVEFRSVMQDTLLEDKPTYTGEGNVFESLTMYVDVKSHGAKEDLCFFVDSENQFSPLTYEHFNIVVPKELKDEKLQGKKLGGRGYRKDKPLTWDEEYIPATGEEMDLKLFNMFKKPPWAGLKTDASSPPEKIEKLVDFIFEGDEDQIERFYSWNHHSVVGRVETALFLAGGKGVGKNSLSMACNKLYHPTLHATTNNNFFTTSFNKFYLTKEFLVIDEAYPKANEIKVLHRYMNRDQVVESKGVDQEYIQTSVSFMIMKNMDFPFPLQPDERRFNCLELTLKPLTDMWCEEEIDEFLRELDEEDEMNSQWYNFILNHKPKYGTNAAFKGKTFRRMVVDGLGLRHGFLYDLLDSKERGERVPLGDIRKQYQRISGTKRAGGTSFRTDSVERFLNQMAEAGMPIGRVDYSTNEIICKVSPLEDYDVLFDEEDSEDSFSAI